MNGLINKTKEELISYILELEEKLIAGSEDMPKVGGLCPFCKIGKLILFTGKLGMFLGCNQYYITRCKYKQNVSFDCTHCGHENN